ncbi:hypothetical protein [Micromonospora halophytica]|uniref:Uncharacterized protein n=1 Tax=Micromonospora halophytica TaxID=47864 RepID=A0A1C5I8I4_9ACTN|nr:hypothetical protein [Micromonospora halophytica]SCG54106.1 hypothetical protein GA0070560_108148 [Micromonospora halophytica]
MATPRPVRLRRRGVLGIPALVTAAALAVAVKPAPAAAAPKVECLADLLGAS